jgi:hypothetical protein
MIIQQLSVFLENKSGRLTEVTDTLGELGINISALSIADTADYGILRMIVAQPEKAIEALRTRGFSVSLTEVICVVIEDTPGSLALVLRLLSDHEVSIEYMYAFAFGDKAYAVIRTESVEQAIRVLQDNQLELRTSEEIRG